jgi:ketosteroid isomerase-like protein
MTPTPLDVIREMYAAREVGNRIKMMALCHEQIAFSFNADPDRVGHGTVLIGWTQTLEHLARVRQHWEELKSDVITFHADPAAEDAVIARLAVSLLHRASGEVLDTIKTQHWVVRDGIVTQMFETLDANMIQALQRLADAYGEHGL